MRGSDTMDVRPVDVYDDEADDDDEEVGEKHSLIQVSETQAPSQSLSRTLLIRCMAIALVMAVSFLSIFPFCYFSVAISGCKLLPKIHHENYLSLHVLRTCVFSKLYPPTPLSSRVRYVPDFPDYGGLSSHFNPKTSCRENQDKIKRHVRQGLLYYKEKGGVTLSGVEYLHQKPGWWGDGYMRVQIINGKLYAVPPTCCLPSSESCCTPWLGPREKQTLSQLWALVQMFDIKNVDFVIKTSDEPSYGKNEIEGNGKMYAPLFAWNGLKNTPGVVLTPFYSNGINDILAKQLVRKRRAKGWNSRSGKAVWRGSPTGGVMFDRLAQKQPVSPRGTMCLFSSTELGKKYIDFAFSSNLPTNHEHVSKISPCKVSVDSRLSLGQQEAEYKYILDLSGNGWSSRFPYLLGLDMVVLKEEDDPFTDFCHDMSTPGVDYVPFTNTSNLVQAMKALRSSDEYSISMINRSSSFVHQYCSKDSQMCYWKILLDEYYKLQKFKVDYPHKNAIGIDHSYFDTNITMLEFFFGFFFVLWAFTCQCCLYISCKKERHVCCTVEKV